MTLQASFPTDDLVLDRIESLAIVLPVYNEAGTIADTVDEIYEKVVRRIDNCTLLIFEDGSSDGTKDILPTLSERYERVRFFSSGSRKGYSKAVKDALTSNEIKQYTHILFADSDGQYFPEEFIDLIEKYESSDAGVVMGRRMNRSESRFRVFLSGGMRKIENALFPIECVDVTSALRIMDVETASKIASKISYSKYNFWLEFTPRMYEEDVKVIEVPVRYRQREGDSNVYSGRKMPKILWNELSAITKTYWEYKKAEITKFLVVGASGALVILSLTYLFTSFLHILYLFSAAIAIEISIMWAFALNDIWTFSSRKVNSSALTRFAKYNFISLGGLAINTTVLFILTTYASLFYLLSEFIGILFGFAFNFLASSKFAWNKVTD